MWNYTYIVWQQPYSCTARSDATSKFVFDCLTAPCALFSSCSHSVVMHINRVLNFLDISFILFFI
jgi:hypothetical protein